MNNNFKKEDNTFDVTEFKKQATPVGWICPVCGRGLAPWINQCPCFRNTAVLNVILPEDVVDLNDFYKLCDTKLEVNL